MCWIPELVEFPCEWRDDGQDNFEELGIEPTTHVGTVMLDVKSIIRMNKSSNEEETNIEVNGTIWTVKIPIAKVKEIIKKCGVSTKSYKEFLSQPVKT